jgi:hypothetical protein
VLALVVVAAMLKVSKLRLLDPSLAQIRMLAVSGAQWQEGLINPLTLPGGQLGLSNAHPAPALQLEAVQRP